MDTNMLAPHEEPDVQPHAGAGVGMARVAQFSLGQTDICQWVPCLMKHENVT